MGGARNGIEYLCCLFFPQENLVVDVLLTFSDESPDESVVVFSPWNVLNLRFGGFWWHIINLDMG
jgi:hypothetical protein